MDQKTYDKNFKENTKGEVLFTGEKLEIYIPRRYVEKNLTYIETSISTVAIFEVVINDTIREGFFLPGFIRIFPSSIDSVTIGEDRYIKATLVKNDVFMQTTEIVKTEKLAYLIWNEFFYLGNIPAWMSYQDVVNMFRTLQTVTGLKFGVPPVVFEIICSQLARSPENLDIEYRLTDRKKKPIWIPLHSVAHAATSASARIIGSYFNEGINVTLLQDQGKPSELENILRA